MKIPDNIYMNICKVFQELYKNKFVPNELNIAEVGSRGKNMTCRYRITVPEEMESVTFSYYDAVVYDAVYTLYRANCSKFALTDLLRVMSGDEKVNCDERENSAEETASARSAPTRRPVARKLGDAHRR